MAAVSVKRSIVPKRFSQTLSSDVQTVITKIIPLYQVVVA